MSYNLFNMFDPLNKNLSLNYILLSSIFLLNYNYWSMKNMILTNKIYSMPNKNITNYYLNNLLLMIIFMINLMNILPLMYSNSHHITFTFNLTLTLWMMNIIYVLINNYNIMFMNLSPMKTSLSLIFIINIIEFNSMIFTILSISMRLMINMMMGHLIFFMLSFNLMIYIYMIIEMFIIMIQSYIFVTLNLINLNNMN